MRSYKKLEEILRLMHEEEVVKKIATSKDHVEEYEEQKHKYSEKIKGFINLYECGNYYDKICQKYAPSFFIFSVMLCRDVDWFIANEKELVRALDKVEDDKLKHIAALMANFISSNYISTYEGATEEIINQIFS